MFNIQEWDFDAEKEAETPRSVPPLTNRNGGQGTYCRKTESKRQGKVAENPQSFPPLPMGDGIRIGKKVGQKGLWRGSS